MKFIFLFFFLFSIQAFAQEQFIRTSVYAGLNLYVQNPFADEELDSFCLDSISINEKLYSRDINKSAIEIRLDTLGIKLGDSVTIVFHHKKKCRPKILRSMAPMKRSKVIFAEIQIDSTGKLTWNTINDSIGIRPSFCIEQFRMNKWVSVSEVRQKWEVENRYEYKVDLLPGLNTFRVGFCSFPGLQESESVQIQSGIPPKEFIVDSLNKKIIFSDSVHYEIQTKDGWKILDGNDRIVDISTLTGEEYILYYDNEMLKLDLKRSRKKKRKRG